MKRSELLIGASLLALTATGCSSAFYRSQGGSYDDMYAVHDRAAIAEAQRARAEARKAEAEARRAEWEALLAEAEARAAAEEESGGYGSVLADDYESAYARRLRGFRSSTYHRPASYFELSYNSPTAFYASAYDPAVYNVVVMGDQIWVEPKYITSMFGSWGGPAVYDGGWYFGFGYTVPASFWWGYPRYTWWDWAWYGPGPYYPAGWWGWYHPGWGPGWWGCPHGWAPPARPHNYRLAGGGTASRYRPGTAASGGRYRSGTGAESYRPGSVSRGGTTDGNRVYYESGGRTSRGNRVYDTPNGRNTYTPAPSRNEPRSSFNPGSRFPGGSPAGSGSPRGGSFGGSRGGSASGGSRGFGGR